MIPFLSAWPPSPANPTLPADELHVWVASLNRSQTQLNQFWQHLSEDERARANRFYFDHDREHYIVARGLLRQLLGNYLQLPAHLIAFAYGEHGKPELAAEQATSGVRFNISHAQGVALLAFSRNREVGVDIEQVRPLDDGEQIAERFFSENEVAVFTAVPPEQKPQAFFNCWTRKEAFIKVIGEGLSCPLDSFDVTLKPGEPADLLQVKGSREAAARWRLENLEPANGYAGAVIAEGREWQLRTWQWPA
ncbi:4'-phosphopantetheinyl transferase family protein [Candidatus Leptofilum sp.]|uniref:4'-phosphopantetheinyl transferase family protein n=1 Tax=Candidatus Leptofilum sp. TaxID=3241576 RepID=UPI003B59B920